MKDFINTLLDWIYKKKCYFCGKSHESVWMCTNCYNNLEFLPLVKNRTISGVNVYCAGKYDKNLQKLIRGLKYHKKADLAYYQAKFMAEYWKNLNINGDFQVIPVPIHKKKKKTRKYNHMDLVADEFCNILGYECNKNCITRIKDTKPQYKLTKLQRDENLKNAFSLDKSRIINKPILIIDDICTTGSTFAEMIKVLNSATEQKIICFSTSTPFEDITL